jgi:CheY-like chemotaxis protein
MVRLHVLLATHVGMVRKTVAAALGGDPFFVLHSCRCTAETIAAAVASRADLILLDTVPAGKDVGATLVRLRTDPRTALVPVVLLSCCTAPAQCERLKALGAAGVIAKPLQPAAFADQLRRYVPIENILAPVRENFLQRLRKDAGDLSVCRRSLADRKSISALKRIGEIAHALAGAGGTYGFAGITCASAVLSRTAEDTLAGRAGTAAVERALKGLLERIAI